MRFLALAALGLALQGCALAAVPATAWIAFGSAMAGVGVTAYHDCRVDGGCKAVPLPP